jgi:TonB family protein
VRTASLTLLSILPAVLCLPLFAQETKEVVEEFYNEQTKEVYNVLANDEAVKHGPYVIYFKNKKLDEGAYVNGKKDGIWKHYNRKGTVDYIASWKAGVKHGDWKHYEDTVLVSHRFYSNGLPDSVHKCYLLNGKLYAERRYKKGIPYGPWREYYESGKLASEKFRINATHIAIAKTYFEDGTLRSKTVPHKGDSISRTEAYYEGGKKRYEMLEKYGVPYTVLGYYKYNGDTIDYGHLKNGNGLLKQYYDSSAVILYSIEEYVNGKLHGDVAYFHDNGELACTGIMRNGVMKGKWEFYDRKGQLKAYEPFNGDTLSRSDLPSNNYDLPVQLIEPEFQGPDLMAYIKRIKINKRDESGARIEGQVKIRFTIDELGEVKDITLLQGLNDIANEEALRVVSVLPRFSPALYQGEAVPFKYTVLITFNWNER